LNLGHLDFDIVSDFVLRISYFDRLQNLYICRDTFTDVVSALQIHTFLTNKANFLDDQMNVSSAITMNYEQRTMNYEVKNKPKTKPIRTQYKPNTNPIQTQTNPTCSELVEPILVSNHVKLRNLQ
jgi:hypothetical protein